MKRLVLALLAALVAIGVVLGWQTTRGPANRMVVLFSDYGLNGADAAILRGEVKRAAPRAEVYDGSQALPGFDVAAACYVVDQTVWSWPAGTTFVVAVAPGVGHDQRMLAARVEPGHYLLLAPDNGVLTDVLDRAQSTTVREVTNAALSAKDSPLAQRPGLTVLGPAAAHLACGASFDTVGPLVAKPTRLPRTQAVAEGRKLSGSLVYADGWGNLRTNLPTALLAGASYKPGDKLVVTVGGQRIAARYGASYDSVPKGQTLVLQTLGTDRLELAVAYGNAAKQYNLAPGAEVSLGPERPGTGDRR